MSTGSPFPPRGGRVRPAVLPITVQDAVDAARAAGFQQTARSGPDRVHVQRDRWTAATISPTPTGVVVKPAWTTSQMVVVGVVLVLLIVGVCGPDMTELLAR